MADGSIYVALISASAALLGAAVSPLSVAYQNSRQAQRDLRQQHETEARTACIDLLRAAVDLRTQVENNQGYQGEEMRSRLAQVRRHASDAALHAVRIAMIERRVFAELADQLAKAAGRLAAAATNMKTPTDILDLSELDNCTAAFS